MFARCCWGLQIEVLVSYGYSLQEFARAKFS